MKYGLLKKAVLKFDYIFTQDEKSKDLFKSIGHNNVFNSGDTRFDRVCLSKTLNEDVDYIKKFLSEKDCLIAGSTWGKDHEIITNYINHSNSNCSDIISKCFFHKIMIKITTFIV